MPLLEASNVLVRYGQAIALNRVAIQVSHGEMVALVGPNGAGKTTLVKALTGLLKPADGSIKLNGRVAHVPEGRQLFPDLSVDDNLRLGAWRSGDRDPERIYELFPVLRDRSRQRAGTLSGGQQQMVAIGRALIADPELLAIDELSLGLAPIVVQEIKRHLQQIHVDRGLAVLLVEQNVRLAFELCDRAYVLENGRIIMSGLCTDLAQDDRVQRAFLGDALET